MYGLLYKANEYMVNMLSLVDGFYVRSMCVCVCVC